MEKFTIARADDEEVRRVDKRFPKRVFRQGADPDPRFSLANERTFLAWIRTSLALVAAGVALEALDVPIDPRFRVAAAAVFVALGLLAAVQSWVGWVRTEAAMRAGRSLPGPAIGAVIAVGLVVAVVLVVIGSFL
ncbi:DUF202 domain-containing protein [Microbacterium sp. LRZ72]|uniref:YidH family protein n=1 Tax=Microbacterium sp. LRZ72 TaxID=2942481 RepID=UPI0029B9888D|nr:DUF202 domain-containing protein [Microbacterium sp. LRZ72]MDX2376525.1 DUF202 domain-containing protein [Microbacterium sp. LRZ72]